VGATTNANNGGMEPFKTFLLPPNSVFTINGKLQVQSMNLESIPGVEIVDK